MDAVSQLPEKPAQLQGHAQCLSGAATTALAGSKVGAVTASPARARSRGVPLDSRRIVDVSNGFFHVVPGPACSPKAQAGAIDPKAHVGTKAGEETNSGPLPRPDGEVAEDSVAARTQASGAAFAPDPVEEKVSAKKRKKKSRVQVALNTLRTSGVEAYKAYIGDAIGEPMLLRTLAERIGRAEDLRTFRYSALAAIQEKLEALEPGSGFHPRRNNTPGRGRAPEMAARAIPERASTLREIHLVDACCTGNAGKLKRLLKHGNVNVNKAIPEPMLCLAAYMGNASIVRALLSVPGIDVNLAQDCGGTPLYLAVQQGQVETVGLLLTAPCIDVNLASITGVTPLSVAAQIGCGKVTELLLAAPGIDVNVHLLDDTATPLCIAASYRHTEVVDLLLASPEIDTECKTAMGATALCVAVHFGFTEIVEQLIKHGADVNVRSTEGLTPLSIAAHLMDIETVRTLLDAPQCQVNRRSADGGTPLGVAAELGRTDIVRLLLGKGSDPNIGNVVGLTALHIACLRGHEAVVETLLLAGADPNAEVRDPCGMGHSSYNVAALTGNRPIICLLRLHRLNAAATVLAIRTEALGLEHERNRATVQGLAPASAALPATLPGWQFRGETASSQAASGREAETLPLNRQTHHASSPVRAGDLPGDVAPSVPPSPLAQAKDGLREAVLGKLRDDNLEPLDGIRLLECANAAADLDNLCVLYNRLAHIERRAERARRRRQPMGVFIGRAADPAPVLAPVYSLGEKTGLDTDGLEDEMKQHLDRKYHRFVSQAVNDMEFGRGKPTTGYPGLRHASAGIAGVGSCSVFYYADESLGQFRIVGIGRHVGQAEYRLDHAVGALGESGKKLRLS